MGIKGQKINPVGWRVGFYRKWKSHWFQESWNYGLMLHKTLKIKKIIESFLLYKRFAALNCNIYCINDSSNKFFIFVFFYNLRFETKKTKGRRSYINKHLLNKIEAKQTGFRNIWRMKRYTKHKLWRRWQTNFKSPIKSLGGSSAVESPHETFRTHLKKKLYEDGVFYKTIRKRVFRRLRLNKQAKLKKNSQFNYDIMTFKNLSNTQLILNNLLTKNLQYYTDALTSTKAEINELIYNFSILVAIKFNSFKFISSFIFLYWKQLFNKLLIFENIKNLMINWRYLNITSFSNLIFIKNIENFFFFNKDLNIKLFLQAQNVVTPHEANWNTLNSVFYSIKQSKIKKKKSKVIKQKRTKRRLSIVQKYILRKKNRLPFLQFCLFKTPFVNWRNKRQLAYNWFWIEKLNFIYKRFNKINFPKKVKFVFRYILYPLFFEHLRGMFSNKLSYFDTKQLNMWKRQMFQFFNLLKEFSITTKHWEERMARWEKQRAREAAMTINTPNYRVKPTRMLRARSNTNISKYLINQLNKNEVSDAYSLSDLKFNLELILGSKVNLFFINSLNLLSFQALFLNYNKKKQLGKGSRALFLEKLRLKKISLNRKYFKLTTLPGRIARRGHRFGAPFLVDFVLLALIAFLTRNFQLLLKFINLQTSKLAKSKRQIPFLRFLMRLLVNLAGHVVKTKGIRIQFKGRFDRWNRSKSLVYTRGYISFQQKHIDLEFSSSHGLVKKGTYGIRLWVWYANNYHHLYKQLFKSYWLKI